MSTQHVYNLTNELNVETMRSYNCEFHCGDALCRLADKYQRVQKHFLTCQAAEMSVTYGGIQWTSHTNQLTSCHEVQSRTPVGGNFFFSDWRPRALNGKDEERFSLES